MSCENAPLRNMFRWSQRRYMEVHVGGVSLQADCASAMSIAMTAWLRRTRHNVWRLECLHLSVSSNLDRPGTNDFAAFAMGHASVEIVRIRGQFDLLKGASGVRAMENACMQQSGFLPCHRY
jgi:hypothetical protein